MPFKWCLAYSLPIWDRSADVKIPFFYRFDMLSLSFTFLLNIYKSLINICVNYFKNFNFFNSEFLANLLCNRPLNVNPLLRIITYVTLINSYDMYCRPFFGIFKAIFQIKLFWFFVLINSRYTNWKKYNNFKDIFWYTQYIYYK